MTRPTHSVSGAAVLGCEEITPFVAPSRTRDATKGSLSIARVMLYELTAGGRVERCPEPTMAMADPKQVEAFERAVLESGVMDSVYLFHGAQIARVIRPGDRVLDIGCGPATQTALVAGWNPDVELIGVDLSDEMLARAKRLAKERGLTNLRLQHDDMTHLRSIPDQSIDAVVSTAALHHLPSVEALNATFAAVARVLKPGGGLYLADLGRLRSERSMKAFSSQYAHVQPEAYTRDYLYSLRAAFSVKDLRAAQRQHLPGRARVNATFPMPLLIAVRSEPRRRPTAAIASQLRAFYDTMSPCHRADARNVAWAFRLGGLGSSIW